MYKQSSSRNQRSKGIKVKHVLQVCLLLAVCFWLVYQVKRSHDKNKEFDEHDAKISLNIDRKDEVMKLGRKYLHPRVEETTVSDGKHDEEVEEEENIGEEEEENKHEEEEQEDNKTEEKDDDEGKGGVDEEVDDPDQEKSDTENDREEDFIDDEKEREIGDEQESEEKDSEDNNAQTENDSSLLDHDHEGAARNTHEAREENYKADDASSAVTHDTQITTTDNETGILEKSNEQAGMNILEHENTSNDTEESNASQNTLAKVEDGETANKGSYLSVTTNETSEITSSNSNVNEGSDDESKINNNSTEVRRETRDLSLLSGNETTSELTQVQSIVEGGESAREESNLQILAPKPEDNSTLANKNSQYDFNSIINTKSDDTDSNHGELLKLYGDTKSFISEIKSNVSAEVEDISGSSMMENNEVTQDVKDDTGGINEGSDESNSEISDEVPRDPIDSSDSSISLEEKDVRVDLETLPEIQTEGSNSEDAAAE